MTLKALLLTLLLLPAQLIPLTANAGKYDDLRILSHNLYLPVFAWGLGTGPGNGERANLIGQAEYLRGYDVLVLNELFDLNYQGSGPANQVLNSLANEYPFQTPILASNLGADRWQESLGYIDPIKKNGGVAVLSRWPIEYQVQVMYNVSCGDDALDNKGFVYARILRNGQRLHLIATHTQSESSRCGGAPAGSNERLTQFSAIHDFIEARQIPADEPVIIAGDLNVKRDGSEYSAMLQTLDAREPAYLNQQASWDPSTNDLAAKQYPNYKAEHLDYLLLSNGHGNIAGWGNATLPVSSADTWQASVIIPDNYHYESDEFSDHFPVIGLGGAAKRPMMNARQARYQKIRLRSVYSSGYLGVGANSDSWLTTNHDANEAASEFTIESWGEQYSDSYCLTSNNYKLSGGWPGAYVKLRSNLNGRYMNFWHGGEGDYGYYTADEPSSKLFLRKVGPTSDGCLNNGDRIVFGDFGGSFWYYVRNWSDGPWRNHLFLWDASFDQRHEFIVELTTLDRP